MYNLLFIEISERIAGEKLPAILGKTTKVSERTWRQRNNQGWEPKPQEIERLNKELAAHTINLMQTEGGWNENEAYKFIDRLPSHCAGISLPTADLIYQSRPGYEGDYAESIAAASQFDRYSHALINSQSKGDLETTRKILSDCLEWICAHFQDSESIDADLKTLQENLLFADDMESILECSKILGGHLYFHVLSCWDIEFCSQYFGGEVEPYPLFKLVMPRISPTVDLHEDTNQFLRNGVPVKRGLFEKSMSRLLDFVAVLISWRKNNEPPKKKPSVIEMADWFSEDTVRISSWRDETTHLTGRQFFSIWEVAVCSNSKMAPPPAPAPMLIAANFFNPLLIKNNGNWEFLSCLEDYERWWNRNMHRLTAKGLKFGTVPWPTCLTD